MRMPRRLLATLIGLMLVLSVAVAPVSARTPFQPADGNTVCDALFSVANQFEGVPGGQFIFHFLEQALGCQDNVVV